MAPWIRWRAAIVLALAICSTNAEFQVQNSNPIRDRELQEDHTESDGDRRTVGSVGVHRELGFFVNRGDHRVVRGPGARSGGGMRNRGRFNPGFVDVAVPFPGPTKGPTPLNIDRNRDPLQEGMWTRKRVDRIRSTPAVAPVVTPFPTVAETLDANASVPTIGSNATQVPTVASDTGGGAPVLPAATATPGATTNDTVSTTIAPTVAGAGGGLNDTMATEVPADPGLGANTTVPPGGVAADPSVRTFQYTMMKPRTRSEPCSEGAQEQDLTFGIEIQVQFPDHRFKACTGDQFQNVTSIVETTLSSDFPELVPDWPETVEFTGFEFDVNQFTLHVNPFPEDDHQRHLLRKEKNIEYRPIWNDAEGRGLEEGGCPENPTICEETADVCMFGCGLASVKDCGDLSEWQQLGQALSLAISALHMECLGGNRPVLVNVNVLHV